jgi:hypothetical protein
MRVVGVAAAFFTMILILLKKFLPQIYHKRNIPSIAYTKIVWAGLMSLYDIVDKLIEMDAWDATYPGNLSFKLRDILKSEKETRRGQASMRGYLGRGVFFT